MASCGNGCGCVHMLDTPIWIRSELRMWQPQMLHHMGVMGPDGQFLQPMGMGGYQPVYLPPAYFHGMSPPGMAPMQVREKTTIPCTKRTHASCRFVCPAAHHLRCIFLAAWH